MKLSTLTISWDSVKMEVSCCVFYMSFCICICVHIVVFLCSFITPGCFIFMAVDPGQVSFIKYALNSDVTVANTATKVGHISLNIR